jgi:hypothetical protein
VTVKELADDEAAFGLEHATELADGRAGIGDLAEGADQVGRSSSWRIKSVAADWRSTSAIPAESHSDCR